MRPRLPRQSGAPRRRAADCRREAARPSCRRRERRPRVHRGSRARRPCHRPSLRRPPARKVARPLRGDARASRARARAGIRHTRAGDARRPRSKRARGGPSRTHRSRRGPSRRRGVPPTPSRLPSPLGRTACSRALRGGHRGEGRGGAQRQAPSRRRGRGLWGDRGASRRRPAPRRARGGLAASGARLGYGCRRRCAPPRAGRSDRRGRARACPATSASRTERGRCI